jgi:hypothetical protein
LSIRCFWSDDCSPSWPATSSNSNVHSGSGSVDEPTRLPPLDNFSFSSLRIFGLPPVSF